MLHKAMGWTRGVYGASAGFPAEERFGLTAQLRRAAVSASSNAAEGEGRSTHAEAVRFLEIAHGSLVEAFC
ncbi:MAG TPA: four helix bundle protein [Chthonomonadales bacterium]|nr:four helix bundle protein [Chthonomonadales bacterium]